MKSRSATVIFAWGVRFLIVVGVLVALFVNPSFFVSSPSRQVDTAIVRTYDAVMDIDRNGVMQLTETLQVDLPANKHGIFRIFDTAARQRSEEEESQKAEPGFFQFLGTGDKKTKTADHPVTVESIERDGAPEKYSHVESARGTMNIKIGDPNVTVTPGVHTYTIRSRTVDVFEPGTGDTTWWWWNVVGNGWQMPINSAHITANLPADPLKAECVRSTNTHCEVSVEGRTMRVNASSLDPFEPVTTRVTFPAAALSAPATASSSFSVGAGVVIALSVIAALISGAVALLLVSKTREKPVGLPVLYEPPEGIYPALGAKVLDELDSPYALQATLFQLAERGLLSLQGNENAWNITVVGEPSQTIMTAAESGVLAKLGLNYQGSVFSLGKNVSAGERVSKAQRDLNSQVSVDSKPYLDFSAAGCSATVLGWIAVGATAIQLFFYFSSGGTGPIWPLLIASAVFAFVAAQALFDRAVWTVRNKAGRDLWSRVGGFGRFLTTDSSESRFDFAERQDLYPRYLPWALVLGSADAWAQRYRDQGVEPPIVPWLIWTGAASNYSMTSMSNSFNSSISSASAAYAASQSSSGGGGGFSGGSGGGGGGGGSW